MPKKHPVILLVEDEKLLLASIIKKMEKNHIDVVSAPSGEEAIKYLEKASSPPALIWLDFYLQGDMDGLAFLEKVRAVKAWAKIPVIVVSNSATENKIKRMTKLGTLRYFLKAEHLLSEIVDCVLEIVHHPVS